MSIECRCPCMGEEKRMANEALGRVGQRLHQHGAQGKQFNVSLALPAITSSSAMLAGKDKHKRPCRSCCGRHTPCRQQIGATTGGHARRRSLSQHLRPLDTPPPGQRRPSGELRTVLHVSISLPHCLPCQASTVSCAQCPTKGLLASIVSW
eukprot:1063066-Pelagomonas_calceolata.AAC.2